MRVLVACEFSGAVRDAFAALGHDAMSCDLLPTEAPGQHYQGDVRDILHNGWDLMVAHPPCTHLCRAGARWLYDTAPSTPKAFKGFDRWKAMVADAVLFRDLLHAPIPRVAVENPRMHPYALQIVGTDATQYVEPWQFGHGETKATGLWLRGLPPLMPTDLVTGREARVHRLSPSEDRWKLRSLTYPGIAAAMAAQWGGTTEEACA